jgi:hypothetical protein
MLKIGLLVALSSALVASSSALPILQDGDFIFALSIIALLVALIPRLDRRPGPRVGMAMHWRNR